VVATLWGEVMPKALAVTCGGSPGLVTPLVALLTGLLAALVTAYLAHHLWKRHWRSELQFALLKDVSSYMNEQLLSVAAASTVMITKEAVAKWLDLSARVRLLFAAPAVQAVYLVDTMLTPASVKSSVQAQTFREARDAALKAMLDEIGIGPSQRYWFDQYL